MKIQLLRHATTLITFGGKRILVDPVLNAAGAGEPIRTKKPGKGLRNPLVELPIGQPELQQLLKSLDAILITHMHRDHFDDLQGKLLPKDIPMICQSEDEPRLKGIGFTNLDPITGEIVWEGIKITRTGCFHGGWYFRRKMGVVSGFVLKTVGEPTLYITGDTIWCSQVRNALKQHQPEVVLLYAGAAQFPFGRSITMNTNDIVKVCKNAPNSKLVAVHMEAINHCLLTRDGLRHYLVKKNLAARVAIPQDGERLEFGNYSSRAIS